MSQIDTRLKVLNERFAKKPLKESTRIYEGEILVSEEGDRCITDVKKWMPILIDNGAADYWTYYASMAEYVKRVVINHWQWDYADDIGVTYAAFDIDNNSISFVFDTMPEENPNFYEEVEDLVNRYNSSWVVDDDNAFTITDAFYYINEP